ncbi:MAG: hypothetical protein ACI9JN_002125 [Bacteroidia bacterium]|jgi:hypothetical protein
MKKIFLLSILASVVMFGCKDEGVTTTPGTSTSSNPTMASMEKSNRNAVLEDFTGVRCGYCPDGHRIANDLLVNNPDRFMVIAVNAGGYAAPASGWANFTSSYGQAFVDQSGVTGYPAGTMNRQYFAGKAQNKGTGLAMSRNHWTTTAAEILADESPVNIGAKAVFNSAKSELTVTYEVYYTGDESANENFVNIALLQSGMVANQSGGGASYVHKHVLRDLLTGPWGTVVPSESTAEGKWYTETVAYDVPTDYNGAVIPPGGGSVVPEDLDIVIFVARGRTDIITGIHVDVTVE